MFHYPVIRTEFCGIPESVFAIWPQFTHVIFTSQTTVAYWPGPWDKQSLAIGDSTASALRKHGLAPLVAPFATQEGVIELIEVLRQSSCPPFNKSYFFIPHSRLARPNLIDYMKENQISFYSLELYDTLFQRLEPVPDLGDFDEIVFTSPSTVEGFLRIYGNLPQGKKLTPIGPVTEAALWRENIQGGYI